jgi:hypothetical protein
VLAAGLIPAWGEEPVRGANDSETLAIPKVFHIAGVPGVKRNGRGTLVLSPKTLVFLSHDREALVVPYQRIRRVTTVDASRESAKAAYTAVVTLGAVGALLLMQEHHVDAPIVDFDNERGGHMSALFQVPKKEGFRCRQWLAHAGVQVGPAASQVATAWICLSRPSKSNLASENKKGERR